MWVARANRLWFEMWTSWLGGRGRRRRKMGTHGRLLAIFLAVLVPGFGCRLAAANFPCHNRGFLGAVTVSGRVSGPF